MSEERELLREIETAINRTSAENESNTPDYVLAQFLMGCLAAWNTAVQQRETWYGRDARPSLSRPEGEQKAPDSGMPDEKAVPKWVTSWPDWYGPEFSHQNVTVVPKMDYDALRTYALALREKRDGWRLMPREPTDRMHKAGLVEMRNEDRADTINLLYAYRAMLDAAPSGDRHD
jgi:hypothetical protein